MKILNLSQKGQSSLEAAVMAFLLVIFLSILFATLYVIYASYWIDHALYESLICNQERGQKQYCVNESVDKLRSILVFDNDLNMRMETQGSISRSMITIKLTPLMLTKKTLSFTKKLRI